MTFALPLLLAISITASALTWAVRRYAISKSILDIPNHRSSHTVPTPRGGGLAIAATTFCALAALAIAGLIPKGLAAALVGGGALVAFVGWLDDKRGVQPLRRAAVHLMAAVWALAWLGGLPEMSIGWTVLPLGWIGSVLAVVGIIWMTNLFNFMDGIDGLAGSEAVAVGLFGGGLLWSTGHFGIAIPPLIVAAAALGFLVWNWSPAKIFMGDVGSGLLGFLFAVIAIASENSGAVSLLVWVLLLGVFVVDATVTLIRRALRGDRWYDAHRSHAYQRAVQAGYSHAHVSFAIIVLNMVLFGFAVLSLIWSEWLLTWVAAGIGVLVIVYRAVERTHPMGKAGEHTDIEPPVDRTVSSH